jgi:hypothetical protein
MLQVANTQPNVDFAVPPGVSMVQIDETSGGVATPNCPKTLVVTAAFKSGTEPTIPCPIHSPQQQPMMTTDQFGNPIALNTALPTSTEGAVTTTDTGPPPDSTLTGGVFRTDTAPPPPILGRERERPRPPATDTSTTTTTAPPTNTDTSTTTSPPPQ